MKDSKVLQSSSAPLLSSHNATEMHTHFRNRMLEIREENLRKLAWESYLGQNFLKVLTMDELFLSRDPASCMWSLKIWSP